MVTFRVTLFHLLRIGVRYMLVIRKSRLTGKTHNRDIDVTSEQINRWQAGEMIQDVMPHLSPDDREFLISGTTPEEWDAAFGEER